MNCTTRNIFPRQFGITQDVLDNLVLGELDSREEISTIELLEQKVKLNNEKAKKFNFIELTSSTSTIECYSRWWKRISSKYFRVSTEDAKSRDERPFQQVKENQGEAEEESTAVEQLESSR